LSLDPHAVLAIHIKLPPEALVPLLIGVGALLVLVFFGATLQGWKARSPVPASRFGLVAGALLTGVAIYFLVRCLTNQSDPNNDGPGNLSFIDPPVAGFMAALATAFWRFGDRRAIALVCGLGVGVLMLIKPFVWPVLRVWDNHTYARGMMDPEHLVFLGAGVVVVITALVAGAKAPRPPPR
jgi:hypothetical protein